MADLADFFAKKDKKKSKPKKFVPEEIAQRLEEAEKKEQERERREEMKREHLREEQLVIDDPNHKKQEAADEWTEEVETAVDLSDLNIQQLQQPELERTGLDGGAADADGNPVSHGSGPWNKNKARRAAGSDEAEEAEPVKAPEPVAAPAPAPAASSGGGGGGGYVPPHRRNMPAESTGGPLAPTRLGASRGWRNKAPDISSDAAFPTLGAAVEEPTRGAWGQRPGRLPVEPFQEVRHGNASSQEKRLQAPKLSLGNQFDALQLSDAY